MKCPNCYKEMDHKFFLKTEGFYDWEDQEIYYSENGHEKFVCKSCKITCLDDEWKIPKRYAPTEKQKKTLLFINNHLGMDIEPLTKYQCWLDIGKYFKKAKNTLYDDQYYIDMQENMDVGDFY